MLGLHGPLGPPTEAQLGMIERPAPTLTGQTRSHGLLSGVDLPPRLLHQHQILPMVNCPPTSTLPFPRERPTAGKRHGCLLRYRRVETSAIRVSSMIRPSDRPPGLPIFPSLEIMRKSVGLRLRHLAAPVIRASHLDMLPAIWNLLNQSELRFVHGNII